MWHLPHVHVIVVTRTHAPAIFDDCIWVINLLNASEVSRDPQVDARDLFGCDGLAHLTGRGDLISSLPPPATGANRG